MWLCEGRIKSLTHTGQDSQIRVKEIRMSLWIQRLREECDLHLSHEVYVTMFTKYSTVRTQSSI